MVADRCGACSMCGSSGVRRWQWSCASSSSRASRGLLLAFGRASCGLAMAAPEQQQAAQLLLQLEQAYCSPLVTSASSGAKPSTCSASLAMKE